MRQVIAGSGAAAVILGFFAAEVMIIAGILVDRAAPFDLVLAGALALLAVGLPAALFVLDKRKRGESPKPGSEPGP
jgi:hypothetical protein